MSIGDLVYDCANGLHGIIVADSALNGAHWTVFYEDGQVEFAFSHELEVINGN